MQLKKFNLILLIALTLCVKSLTSQADCITTTKVELDLTCKGTLSGQSSSTTLDCTSIPELKAGTTVTMKATCYAATKDSCEGHTRTSVQPDMVYMWNEGTSYGQYEVGGSASTASDKSSSTYTFTLPDTDVATNVQILCKDESMYASDTSDGISYTYQTFNFSVKKSSILSGGIIFDGIHSGLDGLLGNIDVNLYIPSTDDSDSTTDVSVSPGSVIDTDGDGIMNDTDTDDDNDGVADLSDAFSIDATESTDTDGDGIGNNTDDDDDGDGVADTSDAFPTDSTESADTDSDGIGNTADTDDDGDEVADTTDSFPTDATESIDTDRDGVGDNADLDDDGNGIADADEVTNTEEEGSSATEEQGNSGGGGCSMSGGASGANGWICGLLLFFGLLRSLRGNTHKTA